MILRIFIVVSCFSAVTFGQYVGSPCNTPNRERGTCVSIYNCQYLLDLLRQRIQQQFLRQSQCGFDQNPLVCCRSGSAASTPQSTGTENNQRPSGGGGGTQQLSNLLPSRSQCGVQGTSERILGGEVTDLDEFPWMALLEYQKNGRSVGFLCGGSLINPKYILTAAHCVTGRITSVGTLNSVRLGEYDTTQNPDCLQNSGCAPNPVDIRVDSTIPHGEYKDSSVHRHHDIAIVRLIRNVQYSEFIKPICLPLQSSDRSRIGDNLWVSGWGKIAVDGPFSPVKLKLSVPVVNDQQCQATFQRASVSLISRQMCAGGQKDRDSCNGDSGGPLMNYFTDGSGVQHWFIEGIVSFGAKCGSAGWPGIYTRVSEYVDWIGENMRA